MSSLHHFRHTHAASFAKYLSIPPAYPQHHQLSSLVSRVMRSEVMVVSRWNYP